MSEKFVPIRIKISAGDRQAWIDKGYPLEELVRGRAEQEEDKPMNKRHKHYETIVAWAEGKEIQWRLYGLDGLDGVWRDRIELGVPAFSDGEIEWRIKPEPKPDVVREYGLSYFDGIVFNEESKRNLRLTFDGETGKLKQAEVIE